MPASTPVTSAVESSLNLTRSVMVLQKISAPRVRPPGFLVAIENGMAGASPTSGRFLVLLVVVDLGELRIDDVLSLAGAIPAASGAAGLALRCSALLGLLVHGLAKLHRGLRERIGFGGDRRGVAALERFLEISDRILDRAPITLADLGAMVGERLLRRMDESLGVVFGLDLGFALLVFLRVRFGIFDHALDVSLGQPTRCLDADLLLLAGSFVLGLPVNDAVGIDIQRHLDLRHAARRGRYSNQIELAQQLVVGRHFAL